MPKHSVLRVHVQSRKHVYRRATTLTGIQTSWGSAWVVDALQLAFAQIPFIASTPELTKEDIIARLLSLGIKPSTKGQYPIIITNAHVVDGQLEINLQRTGDSALLPCSLLCMFHMRDLAILLPPDNLRDELLCSEISSIPVAQSQKVHVYGFPKNGDGELSATEGTLSRTITAAYTHAGQSTLLYEMSATINGGNSGGPVIVRNDSGVEQVIAVSNQVSTNATNQFHAIPIFHLIAAFRDYLQYRRDFGIPVLPIICVALKNAAYRAYYQMEPTGSEGVLIKAVGSMYDSLFKVGDVLLQIDEHAVNSDGKISLFEEGGVAYSAYVNFLKPYSQIRCRVKRNGEQLNLTVVVNASSHCIWRDSRVPNQTPPVFYQHGLVFCGEVGGIAINKAYTVDGKNETPLLLHNRIVSNVFKNPTDFGTVGFSPLTNTAGAALHDVNSFKKVEVDGVTHIIRDIYHLYHIFNPQSAQPPVAKERYVAFFSNESDEIPFFVTPMLTPVQEVACRKRYQVAERFSPSQFREIHLPSNARGWQLSRAKLQAGFFSKKPESHPTAEQTPDEGRKKDEGIESSLTLDAAAS